MGKASPQVKLKLKTFQIGSPVKRGQGLRIGITRHPPRGVPKDRWVRDGYFDVWLPSLAPSTRLISRLKRGSFRDLKRFFDAYERELLASSEGRQSVEFLAQVAARTPIAIGCFCGDESRCHRSRLFEIIQKHAPRC